MRASRLRACRAASAQRRQRDPRRGLPERDRSLIERQNNLNAAAPAAFFIAQELQHTACIRTTGPFLQFQAHCAAADKLAALRQYLLLNASYRQKLRRNSP